MSNSVGEGEANGAVLHLPPEITVLEDLTIRTWPVAGMMMNL